MPPRKPASAAKKRPAASTAGELELLLRVTLVGPLPGVIHSLQAGKDEHVGAVRSSARDLSFDLSVRVKPGAAGEPPRFLGRFTQGPPAQRFVYVCIGTSAGEVGSCWSRRAKVPLSGITPAQIDEARRRPGARLEARIPGKAKDGGPVCATIPLLDGGWRLVEDAPRPR